MISHAPTTPNAKEGSFEQSTERSELMDTLIKKTRINNQAQRAH